MGNRRTHAVNGDLVCGLRRWDAVFKNEMILDYGLLAKIL